MIRIFDRTQRNLRASTRPVCGCVLIRSFPAQSLINDVITGLLIHPRLVGIWWSLQTEVLICIRTKPRLKVLQLLWEFQTSNGIKRRLSWLSHDTRWMFSSILHSLLKPTVNYITDFQLNLSGVLWLRFITWTSIFVLVCLIPVSYIIYLFIW